MHLAVTQDLCSSDNPPFSSEIQVISDLPVFPHCLCLGKSNLAVLVKESRGKHGLGDRLRLHDPLKTVSLKQGSDLPESADALFFF